MDRSTHIRAPSLGLPADGHFPNIRPGQLLQILKDGGTIIVVLTSSRASERTSGFDRVEVRSSSVCET